MARGFVQGHLDFTALLRMLSHSAYFLLLKRSHKLFSQSTCPPFLHGKFVLSIVRFHCFISVTVPSGCRSQGCHRYPTHLVQFALGLHHPIRHLSPSSSVVHEFNAQVKSLHC